MSLTKRWFPLLAAACLIAPAACGSKSKKSTAQPTSAAGATKTGAAAKPKATEAIRGDLAQALLHLRRIHFPYDSVTLSPAARESIATAAETLIKYPKVHIYVQGHADERGSDEYNVALGENRARAVTEYMVRMGVPAERLHVVSYGEEMPLAPGHTPAALAVNRRVDFRLFRGDIQLIVDDGELVDDTGNPIATEQ